MKRRFHSLLIENVNIRTPGLHILTLAVHSHLPELAAVAQHSHRTCQALLYLGGEGRQTFARNRVRVEPGTLVMIPPGVLHSFARSGTKVPLCLAIDFRFRHPARPGTTVSSLNRSELAQVRESLALLARMRAGFQSELHSAGAALVLQVIITLLRSVDWLPREVSSSAGPSGRAISGLLARMEPATSLSDVIRQSGYQRDYLNTLIKRETGLTLGQYRAQQRLKLAKRLLGERSRVSSVASAVGIPDQSYFARWFRKQTGRRPSAWVDTNN
jgi:AraC family transcriptional regulator, transcriptional activator of pobA